MRAERRFQDVRRLANSVLFELHDAIAPLPGSTKARELLTRRGLEYLDAISREPGVNDALRRELAKGYLQLGAVEGDGGAANLGNQKGAAVSIRKGVDLLEELARRSPRDMESPVIWGWHIATWAMPISGRNSCPNRAGLLKMPCD